MMTARRSFTTCITSLMIGLLCLSHSSAQVDRGSLVGLWLLDEGTGAVARDSSGHGYDADLKGDATWVAGRLGSGLEFPGTSYLEIRNSKEDLAFDGAAPFSITAWVKNLGAGTIMAKFNGGVVGAYIFRINGDGTVAFHREVAPWAFAGTKTLPNNEFAHVAVTYDGAVMKIYVNGVLDAQQDRGAQGTDTATPVLIGARMTSGAPSEFFRGVLDEVALFSVGLTEEEIKDVMNGLGSLEAMSPAPADGAADVPRDTSLGWTAPDSAMTHNVYFGASWADVNAASVGVPLGMLVSEGRTEATYTPDSVLTYGETYFWRVDEVNGTPDRTVFRGKVWSFTVEPFAYPLTGVTATASSAQTGMGPQNTVNGSGLNADDQHGTEPTTMWMTNGAKPAWIQFEFAGVEKLHEMWVWNTNQLVEAFLGFGAKDVTVEYSTDGQTWATLEGVPEFGKAPGAPAYAPNTTISFGGVPAQYVRLTINSSWGSVAPQTGLSEVRFFSIPVQAFNPVPASGTANVSVATELDWRPGREATSHKVFVGTDQAAVAGGTVAAETVADHGYSPAGLLLATEYFWKVDEIGDAGTYAGEVWSFTTEPYAIVEDFESYNDDDNRIYEAWIDGLTDSASGSQVGYNEAPFAEKTILHGGLQSMPLIYDNTSFAFSEATRTFATAQDWTARGIQTLSVHFAGAAGNGGKLYVKINSTKIAYDGDATDLARPGWQAWNIDLSQAGNVSSVKSLTIGVEGAGAKGTLYLDDIRLSPKAPEFVSPVEPDNASLIARYAFDGNVNDSSGKGKNGTATGGPTFGPGMDGQALQLDGIDDFVAVGSVGISGAAPRTISGWVKADSTTITDWTNLFGFTSSPDGVAAQSFDMNKIGGANNYCIHAYGWERSIMPIDLEWHHLAATYDGTTVAWYGDGQLVGSEAWVLATQDNVQMGKRGHVGGGNFPGSLDEVRIYNTALSAEEIAWLAGRRLPIHKPL